MPNWMPMQQQAIDPQLIAQQRLAEALISQGTSSGPVHHPMQGIGRILQALSGAFIANRAGNALKDQQGNAASQLTEAAGKIATGIPQWTNPDTQEPMGPGPVAPGMDALRAVMATPQTPDRAAALQSNMDPLLKIAQAYQKEAPKAPEGMRFNNGKLELIPGFVEGKGQITASGWKPVERLAAEAAAARESPEDAARREGLVSQARVPAQITVARAGRETPEEAAAKARAVEMAKREANPLAANEPKVKIESQLRDDFGKEKPVQSFKQAAPIITSMREAAPRDTAGADLNLVYGLAKMFDPDSVVREGEMVLVKNTANLPQQVQGYLNFVLNNGGRLTPLMRKNIMEEAESRYGAYRQMYDTTAKSYQDLASRYGASPENIIMGIGAPEAKASEPAPASPSAPAEKPPEQMTIEELKQKLGIK